MRKLLFLVAACAFMVSGSTVFAQDCVEVDIELPATVVAEPGAFAEGFFEIVNCGDEAALVDLDVEFDINGNSFSVGGIKVPLGAGEVVSRDLRIPVPPVAAGFTVGICLTATVGDASSSDCATTSIESSGGPAPTGDRGLTIVMAAAEECGEIDFELTDTVYTTPGDFFAEGYAELINCGDEATTYNLSVEVSVLPGVSLGNVPVTLGAGESISREVRFPIPPAVPAGEYEICVVATTDAGTIITSCQTVVVMPGEMGGEEEVKSGNYPNPFNPSTTIAFTLPNASDVEVAVYNVLGQQVRSLVDQHMTAGEHSVVWDGRADNGSQLSSGVYFYRITADNVDVTKKMMMLK